MSAARAKPGFTVRAGRLASAPGSGSASGLASGLAPASGLALALVLAGATGCTGLQALSGRNAPGVVDLDVPPEDLAAEAPESPRSPGWNALYLLVEPTVGAGTLFGRTGDDGGFTGFVGLQGGLHRGWSDADPCGEVLAFSAAGLEVGADGQWRPGGTFRLGSVHAEAVSAVLLPAAGASLGFGLGYGLAPEAGAHGPQLTLFNGFGYVRAAWRFGAGGEVHAGLRLTTWPLGVLWSR